jgi:hypothetical protein
MSDHLAFMQLVANASQRRCWLVYRALECAPLDQALELAQRAEEFIVRGASERYAGDSTVRPEILPAAPPGGVERSRAVAAAGSAKADDPGTPIGGRSAIPAEQRRRLIDRLAQGGKNAELAAEFGLTPKQVQGVRIGCAREIAGRRTEQPEVAPASAIVAPADAAAQPATVAASVDDVVRYLRQQDDVVVPQASGEFLVNARFRMPLDELVNRANRIRTRHGKPEFAVANGANGHALAHGIAAANGHALA